MCYRVGKAEKQVKRDLKSLNMQCQHIEGGGKFKYCALPGVEIKLPDPDDDEL